VELGDRVWYQAKARHTKDDSPAESDTRSRSVEEPISIRVFCGGRPPSCGRLSRSRESPQYKIQFVLLKSRLSLRLPINRV
jgi:hypothetical protein